MNYFSAFAVASYCWLLAGPVLAQTPVTFAPVAAASIGAGNNPASLTVADVNGDGKPDLLTANYSSNAVGVQLGSGTGTFGAATFYSAGTGSIPQAIAVADLNGDGQPDIVTANAGSHTAGVLLGTGPGTFGAMTSYSTGAGSNPQGIAVADVNGDGKPDLLTANYSGHTAGVLLGTGTGGFGSVATYSTGPNSSPRSITVADVNSDGKLDLLTANFASSSAGVLLGTGTGTFGAAATYNNGTYGDPYGLAVADVNGDGKLDLLTANYTSGMAGVLLNTGSGTFGPATTYSTGSGKTTSIAMADVNGDGCSDIITCNAGGNTAGVLLGMGTSAGTFAPVTTYSLGTNAVPTHIAVADVDGDGRPDLLTSNYSTNSAGVLLNTTTLTNTPTFAPAAPYTTGPGSQPHGGAVADVNGDGRLDVVTANTGTSTAGVLLGTGTGTLGAMTSYSLGTSSTPYAVAVADVNADGKPDLLTANYGTSTAGVLLGTGTGSFGPVATYSTGVNSLPRSLAVADVNGDSQLDLLLANSNTNTVGVLLGTGAGSFGPVSAYSTGAASQPSSLAVADVNGDGKLDLLTANSGSNTAGVLLGTGTGGFGPVTTYSTGATSAPLAIAEADINGDGKLDLLTANASGHTAGVLLGTGTGSFGAVMSYSLGANSAPQSLAVADVNGDGKPDLLTANYGTSTAGVLLGTGTGTGSFGPVTTYSMGATSSPVAIAVADVNRDGKPDLLTVNSGSNAVGVLLNGTSALATLGSSLPQALATLHPNPTANRPATLTIAGLPAEARTVAATLLSPVGQVVRHLELPVMLGAATASVSTSGLAPGLYLLHLRAFDAQGTGLGRLPTQRLSVE